MHDLGRLAHRQPTQCHTLERQGRDLGQVAHAHGHIGSALDDPKAKLAGRCRRGHTTGGPAGGSLHRLDQHTRRGIGWRAFIKGHGDVAAQGRLDGHG